MSFELPHPCIAAAGNSLHFLVVTVDGDTLTMEAYTADNEKFDSLTIRKQDGKYDDAYLQHVKPEELMLLHLALHNHALHPNIGMKTPTVNKAPTEETPVEVVYHISIPPRIKTKAEIEITLTEGSRKNYVSQPEVAKASIEPGQEASLTFKVRARSRIKIDNRSSKLVPSLTFICKYRLGKHEGALRPISVRYVPNNTGK